MTKDELKALLDENEIEYPAKAKLADLEKLAEDNDLIEEADDEEEDVDESEDGEDGNEDSDEDEDDDNSDFKGKSVDVIEGDRYIRTYSADIHGKGFLKLAKGFVAKKEGRELASPNAIKKLIIKFVDEKNKPQTLVLEKGDGDFKARAILIAKKQKGTITFV